MNRQRKKRQESEEHTSNNNQKNLDTNTDGEGTDIQFGSKAQTSEEVKKSENKAKKILTRVFFGFLMLLFFSGIIYSGHLYVMIFVMFLQALIYRELVNVRYKAAVEKELPLFRTLQWCWFLMAFLYAYGDFLQDFVSHHKHLNWLHKALRFFELISFTFYSLLFVITVLSLRQGYYKYQIKNIVWTILTLCITIGQPKFIAHNIYNGLFWFVFPVLLVIVNDISAYFCGMSFGKKFISSPLLKLSPNKTWEGFIGAFFCTLAFGYFGSRIFSQFDWMVCPVDDFYFVPKSFTCVRHQVFIVQDVSLREITGEIIWFLSDNQLKLLPDWRGHIMPIQVHAIVLAFFASVVAPFGGFAASAIKRAHSIKDFASIIPGHGGVMDRMDCQLIMALCTWIYYKTFIAQRFFSVHELMDTITLLSAEEQSEIYKQLGEFLNSNG